MGGLSSCNVVSYCNAERGLLSLMLKDEEECCL